jgi:sigma-B regulation protein RsbU (phosphoserine phosphatase)
MTPRRHLERLDLASVVAPFDALGGELVVSIEDAAGHAIAGPGVDGSPGDRVDAPVRAHGEPVGRVILHGPAAGTDVARAAVEALGAALSIACEADIAGEAGDARALQLAAELAHGRRLQRSFVSLVAPDVPGYAIASHYEAAREVGGDFFDLFPLRRRGRPLSIVIADVTGKGIAAALLMAFTRPLIHSAIDNATGPAEALERTNAVLVRERRTSLFITTLVGRLDLPSGVLRMANAGHEPPLFIPADGSPPTFVLGSGPLIGAFDRLDVPEVDVQIGPGDIVLLYTDGITDARTAGGDRFSEAGFLAAVERARGGSPQDVIAELTTSLDGFVAGAEPTDDVTLVAIGRRPAVAGACGWS